MVKSDPVINSCASSNHTYQLPSNNFTYNTCYNFNNDISTMDYIKIHKTAHALYTIFHGMVYFQDPVENIRNPLDRYIMIITYK